jgi:hypothetical protein
MATILRGPEDDDLRQLKACLEQYEHDHPGSEAFLYRQNGSSIRVKIVDDAAKGMNRSARHHEAWRYVQHLGENIQQQITVLLLLPRAELHSSLMNLEFDDPISSPIA